MADATRFSVMSKQIEDNKQATDDLRAQMADLAKSQADLCKSASHMEAMLSQFISQNGAQTNRTPILNSPSGCLTASTTLNRMLAELKATTANREATMSKFLSPTSIPHRPPFPPPEPPDLAKLFESPLLHTPAIHPRAPFRPNQNQNNQESIETGSSIQQIESSGVKDVMSTTHKADSVSGEETITSNASESSQVSSQVSPYHLPVFDGTLLDCWIAKMDRFFELKQYGNEEKLDLISLCLEGAALKWFRKHRREFTDWTYIKRKLMARFGLVKGCSPPEMLPKEKLITKVDQDTESFDVREPSEVTVEETIDKSMDMIREERSTPENESSPEVSPQILLSQFQVSLYSLEPGCRYHKESLLVVNDLSSDLGCVIGKTIGCICDSKIGQDNSLGEEEFNRVWEPGGIFIEHDKWQGSEKCHELSIVVRLMQGLPSTRWSYGKVDELTQELQQPKSYLKEVKLKEFDSLKVQERQLFPEDNVELPEVSIISMCKGLVCDKEKERESIEFNECHNHLKKLQAAAEGIPQKIAGGLIYGDVKFHLKHKWRSRLEFCGDETHSKGLLVLSEIPLLNNDNKGDLIFKANWFYNKPMIIEVFHLQRPPELIDLQGNPNFITKVLVQWKEHPPDQFFSGFYGQVLMLSSLRTRMF